MNMCFYLFGRSEEIQVGDVLPLSQHEKIKNRTENDCCTVLETEMEGSSDVLFSYLHSYSQSYLTNISPSHSGPYVCLLLKRFLIVKHKNFKHILYKKCALCTTSCDTCKQMMLDLLSDFAFIGFFFLSTVLKQNQTSC